MSRRPGGTRAVWQRRAGHGRQGGAAETRAPTRQPSASHQPADQPPTEQPPGPGASRPPHESLWLGEETRKGGPGLTIWVPAGVDHGVTNTRTQQLVLLVGLTPPPDKGAATQSTH